MPVLLHYVREGDEILLDGIRVKLLQSADVAEVHGKELWRAPVLELLDESGHRAHVKRPANPPHCSCLVGEHPGKVPQGKAGD
eukprot:2230342-Lingulodinium_polyedra.AAC.1